MKKTGLIIAILFSGTLVFAQEKEGVKDEGAHEAEFNSDAQDRDHSGEIDSRVQPSEDREGRPADAGQQSNEEGEVAGDVNTTTGAMTRHASSSGSPGVMMDDEHERDGTNTMQRAELNVGGAPLPGGERGPVKAQKPENRKPNDNKIFTGDLHEEIPADKALETPRSKSDKKSGSGKKK